MSTKPTAETSAHVAASIAAPQWRDRFVPALLHRDRLPGQVVRFGIVGGMNTIVDFLIFNLLFHVVGLPLLAANTLSVSVAILHSFLWNKHWTFSAGGWARWRREATIFLAVSLVGLLINDLGIYLLHTLTGASGILAVNLQKIGASVASLAWNFTGYRLFAFRDARTR